MSGGLSNTDTGPRGPEVISGITEEFFNRVRKIEQARGVCIKSCESSRGDLRASVFIDASYEGDLMALAGVPYQIGREPRRQ